MSACSNALDRTLLASSEPKEDASESALSPMRRRGLTTAEKLCMRQIPRPSPGLFSKNNWCKSLCSTRKHVRSESSLQALPSDSPVSCRSPAKHREVHMNSRPRIRRGVGTANSMEDLKNPLAAQEADCAFILRRMYPSTLTGMNFMKADQTGSNAAESDLKFEEVESRERLPSHFSERNASPDKRAGSKSCMSQASHTPSHSRLNSKNRFQCLVQQAELQFIRRYAPFDVASASPIGDNALRLVQGASITRNYRAAQQKLKNIISSHRAVVFDFNAQMACTQMLRFKILDTYYCVQDAFNAINVEHHESLNKREWCSLLSNAKLCTLPEARTIFDLMDADHDATVSQTEFVIGLEIIGQVTTMETLRKRLICLGFGSMTQAIMVMNGGVVDITMRPLSFQEFAAALLRASIIEEEEHKAIFELVRDHADPTCRASLSDLACALAVVSPCLLLEDLRMRMIQDHGSLDIALRLLSPGEVVYFDEFKSNLGGCFGVADHEAHLLFQRIDLDGDGHLSQDEIRRALDLAQPSLDLEDCRHKLRQGYRTIQSAFQEAYAPPEEQEGLPSVMHFKVDEFADVLRPLGLGRRNVARLIGLMAVSDCGGVTLKEFFSCARNFCPSCALEELKMQLLQGHQSLMLAFRDVKDRRARLNRFGFKALLRKLDAHCAGVDEIFDFLDIRRTGITIISEMIAALQCLQAGRLKLLSSTECSDKVKSNVGDIFEPSIRFASELKARVKEEAYRSEAAESDAKSPLSTKGGNSATGKELTSVDTRAQAPPMSSRLLQSPTMAGQKADIPTHLLGHRTFMRITSTLQVLPEGQEKKNVRELTNYFDSAQNVLIEQKGMVDKNYRRSEERHIVEQLKKFKRSGSQVKQGGSRLRSVSGENMTGHGQSGGISVGVKIQYD